MAYIQYRTASGKVEKRRLSKSQPLSIGKHRSSDLRIDEKGVGPLHCRISWNKGAYEIVAATPDGVQINGSSVRKWKLSPQDVIQIGSVKMRIVLKEDGEKKTSPKTGQSKPTAKRPADKQTSKRDVAPAVETDKNGTDIGESIEFILARDEDTSDPIKVPDFEDPASGRGTASAATTRSSEPSERIEDADFIDDNDLIDDDEPSGSGAASVKRRSSRESSPSKLTRLKSRLGARPARPGEQDVLRSPFVLVLGGGAVVLLLVSATFWFIIQRQQVQQQLGAARSEYEQGHFTQAIALFEGFLMKYPRHEAAQEALLTLGKAQIEKEILGATPSWKNGLAAVQEFIQRHRDDEDFGDLRDTMAKYAKDIALGSLKTAADTKNRNLLDISSEAATIFDRYAPTDPPPTGVHEQLRTARETAERVIRKHEAFEAALANITAALDAKHPLDALEVRRRLIERYPDLLADKKVVDALGQILTTAKELVQREELGQDAETDERPSVAQAALTLALHTRALSAEVSDGRNEFVLAKGCCFGIDRVTGDPVWRRVIGLDTPFFPLLAQTSQAQALLTYDTRFQELVLVERHTGKLIWRQAIADQVSGAPIIFEGQIYLATVGGHLYLIDLETGKAVARLTCSQELHAPPVLLVGGAHLVVAGDEQLLYTFTLRPLACQSVMFLGHKPGSLVAPLLSMGELLLIAENDRLETCRLRVLNASQPDQGLVEIEGAGAQLDGQVRDTPVLRGNALFVPSSGERVAAFTVSDDPNQPALTVVGRHAVKTEHPGPMFLSAGADGRMWMAGSALRRFRLKTNSISLDPNPIAVGLSTQPLQSYGQFLFVGRRLPYSGAVRFAKIDREATPTMTSLWKTVVGAEVLTVTASGSNGLVCLTEEGDLFHVTASVLRDGGFRARADGQIELPKTIQDPLRAAVLADGQVIVHCGNPTPKLWLLNALGQVRRAEALPKPLETNPVPLAGGLVLPLPQKLTFQPLKSGQLKVEEFTAPVEDQTDTVRWTALVALDENQIIATTSQGSVLKIQLRKTPVPHLYEASKIRMGHPVDVAPIHYKDKIVVADASGRIRLLNESNLEPVSETSLDGPASSPLWEIDDRLFVETGRKTLACFEIGATLKSLWTMPLEGSGVADQPLVFKDHLIVAQRSGDIQIIDPKTGDVVAHRSLGQPIRLGPRPIGDKVFVASIDGTLHVLDPSQWTGQ